MQAIRFVAGRDVLVGDETDSHSPPALRGIGHAGEIVRVGLLEETAPVPGLSLGVVVLDREEAVVVRSGRLAGITVRMPAVGAIASVAPSGARLLKLRPAGGAGAGAFPVLDLVEVAAAGAHQYVPGMPAILGEQVARKQVERRAARFAVEDLDPEEGFDGYVLVPVQRTASPIVAVDLGAKCDDEAVGGSPELRNVEVIDLFADDPGGHGIDVEAIDVAAHAVGLDQRCTAAHERVGNPQSGEVVRAEERVRQRLLAEFGEDQAAKQGSRAAGKPLVDSDDRAVVLLNLLLPQRHLGDEGHVKAPFDAHCGVISPDAGRSVLSAGEASAGPTGVARSRTRSVSMARRTTHETETSSRLATSTREA